jgi:hypothetical protein
VPGGLSETIQGKLLKLHLSVNRAGFVLVSFLLKQWKVEGMDMFNSRLPLDGTLSN